MKILSEEPINVIRSIEPTHIAASCILTIATSFLGDFHTFRDHCSLTSHTLQREEGSDHETADELLPRNAIIEQGRQIIRH